MQHALTEAVRDAGFEPVERTPEFRSVQVEFALFHEPHHRRAR
jgi:hypothetical protein